MIVSAEGQGGAEGRGPRVRGLERGRWPGFLPIPAFILLMTFVHFLASPSAVYDPPWLILTGNTLFVTMTGLVVAYVASRNYHATGRIQVLLLGCGVLVFGVGGVLAALVRNLPDGANLNVTIYNTGALAGALFHGVAAFILLVGVSPEVGADRKRLWLALGYVGTAAFMAVLTAIVLAGLVPPFFIQGAGPTPLRQAILGGADLLFVFSFVIFLGIYLRNREVFLYWYSGALALTAISLTAFLIQSSVGSLVGWVGRCSQYLAGFYFLVALRAAARLARVRRTSLDYVLTASLSGAEETFRLLAENAPDVIRRFDRELRHVYVNPAGLRLYGKPAAAVVGRSLEQAGEPHAAVWEERIRGVFATGRPTEVEDSLFLSGGLRFYQSRCVPEIGPHGTVQSVLVVSRDLTERKQAEDSVLRAKEEWERTFDSVPDLIAVIDSRHRILRANRAMTERLGVAPGQCSGLFCYRTVHGADAPPAECPHTRTLQDGRAHSVEIHENRLGGDLLVSTTPLTDAGGRMIGAVHVARDITERKRVQREGETSVEFLRQVNAAGDTKDLVDSALAFFRAQPGCEDVDILLEEGDGIPGAGDSLPEDEPAVLLPLTASGRRLGVVRIGGRRKDMVRPETIAHWERLGGYLAVALAKAGAEEAAQQQARTVQAVNRIFAEAIRCRSVETLGAACLAVAESVTGSRFGFIGEIGEDGNLHDLAISDPGWEACRLQVKDGHSHTPGNFPIHGIYGRVLRDGRSLTVNEPRSHPDSIGTPEGHPPLTAFLGVPLARDGKTYGLIAVANREGGYRREDAHALEALAPAIVEALARKRAEEALRKSERRHRDLVESERAARSDAERANRIKDEFLANLSHELRTPLNAILGWTQILERSGVDERALEGLQVIERNTRAQAQLISDLLDMSRILSGKLRLNVTHCNLGTIAESAVDSIMPAAEARTIRIVKVVDPFTSSVLGDPDRLRQALSNLLANAVKFTPPGGRIHVVVRQADSRVEATVSDTGQGIHPEFLPHLFERFRQADSSATRRHGGLGLGLAIVKHIVETHGGTIRAESGGEGQGATFTIGLPVLAVRPEEGEAPGETLGSALLSESVNLAGIRILVVDDDPDTREMLGRLLSERAASVTAVASSAEALDMVRRLGPDVLISDIGLPEMDGYELLSRIRRLPPEAGGETPAVALTAFSRADDRTRALLAGYGWYLTKPVEASELLATLASITKRLPQR